VWLKINVSEAVTRFDPEDGGSAASKTSVSSHTTRQTNPEND
jgi:hypothetical protein